MMKQVDEKIMGIHDLYMSTAARELFLQRAKTVSKLKRRGFSIIDVLPQQVTPRLINQYLEIKSKNLVCLRPCRIAPIWL